jgi:uncharacterized membrane protein YhaH (DUF805 family)
MIVRPNTGDFWKTLFSAQGRSNRGRFWTVVALCWAMYVVVGSLFAVMGDTPFTMLVAMAFVIAPIPVGTFNMIKRLHDLGRSGWWILLLIGLYLPIAAMAEPWSPDGLRVLGYLLEAAFSLATLVALGSIPGEKTSNRFGEPPGRPPVEAPA